MKEFVYLVDREDKIIGKVDREKAHKDHLLHRAGLVLIFNSKHDLFLAKRSPEKRTCPDCMDAACGFHVKYGETYAKAVKRELFEETHIRKKPKYLGEVLLEDGPERGIFAVYTLSFDGEIKLDPKEAVEGKFYPIEEAKKIIGQNSTTWLAKGLEFYEKVSLPKFVSQNT